MLSTLNTHIEVKKSQYISNKKLLKSIINDLLWKIKTGLGLVGGHVVHFAAEAHPVRALEPLGPEHVHDHVNVLVEHAGEVAQGVPADRLGAHQGRLQFVPVLFLRIANRELFALGLRT